MTGKAKIPVISSNYIANIDILDKNKSYLLLNYRRPSVKESTLLLLEKVIGHENQNDLSELAMNWDTSEEEMIEKDIDNNVEIKLYDTDLEMPDDIFDALEEMHQESENDDVNLLDEPIDEDEDDIKRGTLVNRLIDINRIKTVEDNTGREAIEYNNFKVIYYRTEKVDSIDATNIYANKKNKNLIVSTYGDKKIFDEVNIILNKTLGNISYEATYTEKTESLVVDGIMQIVNVNIINKKDGSVIKEYTNPIGNFSLLKSYEDSNKLITMELNHKARNLLSIANKYKENCKIPLKVEIITDISEDTIRVFRKDNAASINFPKIEFFKKYLNLDYIDESDYKIAYTTEDLKAIYDEISALPLDTVIALDTETTGLIFTKWLKDDPRASELVTIQMSWKDNQAVVIPIRMKNRENAKMEDINKYIKPIMENRRILCHNGCADVLFCKYDNLDINLCEDTMVLSKHIMPYLAVDQDRGRKSRSSLNRSLKTLLDRAFHEDKIDLDKTVFRPLGLSFDFSLLPDEYLIAYGCPDTDRLLKLWKNLRPKLDKMQENAYYEMVKFTKTMALLGTWGGVRLDKDIVVYGRKKQLKLQKLIGDLALACVGETYETLNISSAKKVANFIYTKLGVPVTEKTKRNKTGLSADKEVIEELASIQLDEPRDWFKEDIYTDETMSEVYISKDRLNKAKYPFCVLLAKWRDLDKNIRGYYNSLIEQSIDNIYYIDYHVGSTNTWRTTAGIQTTKGEIKHAILPFDDDWGVLCMDFSSQELRVASNLGRDPEMYKVLASPEADAHRAVAATVFGLKPYQVTHSQRQKGKTTNFRILYGGGPRGLAKAISGDDEPTVAQFMEAENIHNQYYKTYSRMMTTLKGYRDHAQKYGWVQNELGFRMVYDNFLDLEKYENQVFDVNLKHPPEVTLDPTLYQKYKSSVATASGNYPIQSYAAGLLMKLGNKLYDEIVKRGYQDLIYLPVTVHDEINLFYHKSISPFEVFEMVKSIFEIKYDEDLMVPLYVGIGFGDSWGEAKSDEAELPVGLQDILMEEYRSGKYDKTVTCKNAPEYFFNRKKDYVRYRLRELLSNVMQYKIYNTGSVMKLLRDDTFVLAQASDMFGIFNKKTNTYYHENIINALIEGTDIKREDITIIEQDIIEDEDEEDNVVLEPFRNDLNPRVTVGNNVILFDISNLKKNVIENLVKYLKEYSVDAEDSKEIRLKSDGKITQPLAGIKWRGTPITFNIDLDNILKGKEVLKRKTERKVCESILTIHDDYLLVDVRKYKDKELVKRIITTLAKYSSKEGGRKMFISTHKGTIDINLKYNEKIPVIKLQQELMNL